MLTLDIWSDIACPWCWIGKRRLESALVDFEHRDELELRWRAFELDPNAPRVVPSEPPYVDRLARKYGVDRAGAQGMIDRMTNVASEDGLEMRFDRVRPGNTFDAHRLLHLALRAGCQNELKERLFRAYLHEGKPIGERNVLCNLAVEVGMVKEDVVALLEGDALAEEVRADEETARSIGVSGVPFFVANRRYGVSGAQPAEILLDMLERAWSEVAPGQTEDGAACGPGGC